MNIRTKKVIAKEVLIFVSFLGLSLLAYLIFHLWLTPNTRVHPATGETWIINGSMPRISQLQLIAAIFIAMYPVRLIYYVVNWAINTLKAPSTT